MSVEAAAAAAVGQMEEAPREAVGQAEEKPGDAVGQMEEGSRVAKGVETVAGLEGYTAEDTGKKGSTWTAAAEMGAGAEGYTAEDTEGSTRTAASEMGAGTEGSRPPEAVKPEETEARRDTADDTVGGEDPAEAGAGWRCRRSPGEGRIERGRRRSRDGGGRAGVGGSPGAERQGEEVEEEEGTAGRRTLRRRKLLSAGSETLTSGEREREGRVAGGAQERGTPGERRPSFRPKAEDEDQGRETRGGHHIKEARRGKR